MPGVGVRGDEAISQNRVVGINGWIGEQFGRQRSHDGGIFFCQLVGAEHTYARAGHTRLGKRRRKVMEVVRSTDVSVSFVVDGGGSSSVECKSGRMILCRGGRDPIPKQ